MDVEGKDTRHRKEDTDATLAIDEKRKSAVPASSYSATAYARQSVVLAPWESDPRGYYTTFYNQFTSIIMISTFTGGVQAAVLSFMNDILSSDPLNVVLFPEDVRNPGRTLYSAYSLGLMLGLLAVALNLTVAAIAAVNAALACHFSIHIPIHRPTLEARVVFCMILQFIASGVAGISLVMLCYKFDLAFTIVAAVLFFAGILISGYHLVALFGSRWFTELRGQPLHSISIAVSTSAFLVDVISPSPSSWFTISTYGITITYHMLAVLHNRSSKGNRPRRLALFAVVVMVGCWVGCVILTTFLGSQYRSHEKQWESILRWVTIGLAAFESVVLFTTGVFDARAMRKWRRANPRGVSQHSGHGVTQSE
ncbi:hypothetical protein DFP72DRAFT_615962 [Ephemerocybe angulata]|uniref:Uncharacterized protein n=1 Tax=Ephemerocybe angulata TaxID=980116 RepID=A0A8H6LXX1_9AGAR|nr:hypothetical protein DFP72DRAFT_615962 [Tulosesus angulatus]